MFIMAVVASAQQRHRRSTNRVAPVGIERIVDSFVEAVLNDPLLAGPFAGVDPTMLRRSQAAFFIDALGGRTGAAPTHVPVRLDGEEFTRFVLHLCDTLVRLSLPEPLRERILLALAARALNL
jgi:truncated hemoglobin YjbI